MIIDFYKYQGTGNDFIVIDDRKERFDISDNNLIASICQRKTGIGADGLIILRNNKYYDFEMLYFNADGYESTMCGNGGRCIIDFANLLGIIKDRDETIFMAIDGQHKGKILADSIMLQMSDVNTIMESDGAIILDTGSPHYILFVEDVLKTDVVFEGKNIRNKFKEGINVNFVEKDKYIMVRTYERGVENETLSCGTGVVATAIAMHYTKHENDNTIEIKTKGGDLIVSFDEINGVYSNIWLSGSVHMVYAGEFVC